MQGERHEHFAAHKQNGCVELLCSGRLLPLAPTAAHAAQQRKAGSEECKGRSPLSLLHLALIGTRRRSALLRQLLLLLLLLRLRGGHAAGAGPLAIWEVNPL